MKHFLLAAALILSAPAVMACETVTIGDLTIEHAWSKATIGAGRPGVFYVEITNAGSVDDALIGKLANEGVLLHGLEVLGSGAVLAM